jgi:glycosyltransferase involved in cell wall biosynthesis
VHVAFSVLTLFPGRVGGSETNVRGLLREFADGNGPARVTVLANKQVAAAYRSYERGAVRFVHVGSYRAGNSIPTRAMAMATARLLPRLVARDVPRGFDVIHFPVTVPIPSTGVPEVVTLFDVQHLDMPEFFSRAERRYRRWAYEGASRRSEVVITSSEYSKRRLVESAGLAPERVEVVYLGIDHELFRRGEPDAALEGIALPERFVFFPANLWPHKNHLRLVEALGLLDDRDVHLILTGQSYGRLGEVMARARAVGVERRVHHLGYVPRTVLAALYRRAAALVFPSLYEGFGTPPLEAMASGCPVASSSRASLAEICGEAALAFDPSSPADIATALARVTSDAELRARLRKAGFQRASQFHWTGAALRHRAIYERAAATSGRSLP